MIPPAEHASRRFVFEKDTFAFKNELVWQYRFDSATGGMATFRTDPPPSYALRCFVMVRSARQFFYHARFAPELPVASADEYRSLVRRVVRRNARYPSADADKVVIPGFASLRAFSSGQEAVLKAACGGAWQSYVLRSHWRMVFHISREHQEGVARRLTLTFPERPDPVVHIVRFPEMTINHGITLFERADSAKEIRFRVYDPNLPERPGELTYDRASRTFFFPANHYWAGGRVDVIEVYRNWMY
jgi:hypothetical protein